MSELLHATKIARDLDKLSETSFGAQISLPKNALSETEIARSTELSTYSVDALPHDDIVPLASNFDTLAGSVGSIFGLVRQQDKKLILHPGIITARSTSEVIHFTYLDEAIDPQDAAPLSTMRRVMLTGGLDMQDGKTGTEHSHSTVAKTATELGHTAMAMRSLTDAATMDAVMKGKHIAHDWGKSSVGIAPNLTARSRNNPGAFDTNTTHGRRNITFKTIELTPSSASVLATGARFKKPSKELEIPAPKLLLGVGLLAAQQLHGKKTQDYMLKAMEKI